jgi:hypothetical protein
MIDPTLGTLLPETSAYLEDQDRVVNIPAGMDDHDAGHHVRVNEYGEDKFKSSGEYIWSAAKEPTTIFGRLKNTLIDKLNIHPDKDAMGARAVIALNEIDRVHKSNLSDEGKSKELSAISEDVNKYLSERGVYTKQTETLMMNDFLLNVGMTAIGGGAIVKYGAKEFTKGLLKFTASNEALKRIVFPLAKAANTPEGQDYEYKPLTLAEFAGITSETPGLKTGADIIEMGASGGIMMSPQIVQRAKITAVVKEAMPEIKAIFDKFKIKIPEKATPAEVFDISKQFPELNTALLEAADRLPFYKALGERGSIELPGKEPLKPGEAPKPTEIPKESPVGFDWQKRGFIRSIQEEMPELKVSGQYIPRSTDKLSIKAKNLIKDDIVTAERIAQTGNDDNAVAIGSELLKFYTEEAEKSPTEAVKEVLYEKAANLGNNMAKRLTELGRSVQAASILGRMTPEGQVRFAARTIQKYNIEAEKAGGFIKPKKIPELTPDQVKDITESMKVIESLPDGEEKAVRFADLQNYISDLVPTPLFQKIVTIWKAGLLTGMKTTGTNVLSNFSHAFGTEVIKDIPASAVDSVASLFTKKRTTTFSLKGLEGVKEGFSKGLRFLKTGYDERDVLGKLDYKRTSFGKSKIGKGLQKYEETVFRLLGAEDQPFYYGAKARSLYDQAQAQAINKGLKGKEAKAFVKNLVENPTNEMLVYAVADAETAVFQNKTALGEAANKLKQVKPLELVLPFSKTPSAVAMQIINYSPVGLAKTIFTTVGKGKFSLMQREFSQGVGRALTGTGILALGVHLYNKGLVILDRPKSEKEKTLWEAEGKKANSIKISGKYRSIQVLGPAGNLLLIGAQFKKALDDSGSPSEAMAKGTWGSIKSFTEQTYLTGVSQAIGAVTEPEKQGEYFVSSLLASGVPTIVADVAKGTDVKARRAETIGQRVIERLPLLREQLEPKVDLFGRDVMRRENFFEVLLDPTRPSTEINDPVVQEVRRLVDEGLTISTTQLGNKKGYKILSQQQNTEMWQRSGQIAFEKISALMAIPAYANVSDDVKAKKIDEIMDKAKLLARTEKVVEITVGLQGEELKQKLSEAKEDKLLSREVYDLYLRLR